MAQIRPVPSLTVARWLGGPLIWAAHFTLVYASESLVCTRGGGAAAHLALVGLATAIALIMLMAITAQSWRRVSSPRATAALSFMDGTAAMLGLLGMLGVLWSTLPAIVVSSCTLPG
jgi:hypothetical protein